jgi:hypothetical protein
VKRFLGPLQFKPMTKPNPPSAVDGGIPLQSDVGRPRPVAAGRHRS